MSAAVFTTTRERRPRAAWRDEMVAVGCAVWMAGGLFIDGWAHNAEKPETFFTPWHGVLYSGFGAAVLWGTWLSRRDKVRMFDFRGSPPGQQLTALGLVLFAMGGGADFVWHAIFGIEVDIEALLSPSHLILFAAGVLALTGPVRAEWADPESRSPSLRAFAPALISIAIGTAVVAFFFQYVSPFRWDVYGTWVDRYTGLVTRDRFAASDFREAYQVVGIAAILITTVILVGPLLLAMRRWQVPFGTATVIIFAPTFLVTGLDGFEMVELALPALLAGLVTDWLIVATGASMERPRMVWVVGAAAPLVLWAAFFAVFHASEGLGWPVELWSGATVMASFTGLGLAMLSAPPPIPAARR